uniref:Uncharacterized protein n=1 Tax=Myoviridae sp. ctfJc17 TaxID=2827612 RepID=A0A8S5LQV5_9CAUD|nr:MAG TPA: hypothetical protein [Myoviridae sp. ctfJc17]
MGYLNPINPRPLMAAYYIINVYKKAIGFVGLGNNLGYLFI